LNEIPHLIPTLIALLSALIAAGVTYLVCHRKTMQEREERIRLAAELDAQTRSNEEQYRQQEIARQQLADSFNALAGQALKHNSTEFLKLARENLQQFHIQAKGELSEREKAVENLVKPIRETLDKTEQQIRQMEKERREAHGSLSRHLESMAEANRLLQTETRNLVQALRRPEVRGQWGEMTLKRLAELAGMVEYCDFFEQEQVAGEEGERLRPDMVVRMPDSREVIIDAKTPLDAYLSAVEAVDDPSRKLALERHARNMRQRVRELASKGYWQQFKHAPDFVVLFVPGDQFLNAALDLDRQLLEDALSDKVILATPTSLVALLRAVAYGWRQKSLAENAENIQQIGEEFYSRLANFTELFGKLGRSLESSVSNFNKAVGSFDTRLLPSARKFAELGIKTKKEPTETTQIETAVRTIENEPPEE
jgi:DNA recombination protein RmuC